MGPPLRWTDSGLFVFLIYLLIKRDKIKVSCHVEHQDNSLPALSDEDELSSEERAVLATFKPGLELTSANLEETLGLSRSTVVRLISALAEKGALMRVGRGPATRYRLT